MSRKTIEPGDSLRVCRHLETEIDLIRGQCWASPMFYKLNGWGQVEFIRCPFEGNPQKCLDQLIRTNEAGTVWKKYIALQLGWEEHQKAYGETKIEPIEIPLGKLARKRLNTLEFMET